MSLSIVQRHEGDVVILDLTGRLWILDLPLRDLINGLLSEGKRYLVLNIANVHYIDSSGLGQLISIWTSIRSRDGHMTILNPVKRVQRLLEITRLNAVFEILQDEADAVKRAGKASA
jgi:anti-sigma B factor antagonist